MHYFTYLLTIYLPAWYKKGMLEFQPVIKWRSLRKALGLSQAKFANLLSITPRHVINLEQTPNVRVHDSTITILRIALRDPDLQSRLRQSGFPHPFPEDMRL